MKCHALSFCVGLSVAMVVIGSASAQTNYYFSAAGSDATGDGSLANPWRSIQQFNTLDLDPGDGVFFRGGDTFNGSIFLDANDSGTDASGNLIAPIEISSYGTGRATIDAGRQRGLFAENNGGFSVSDLIFQGNGGAPSGGNNRGDGLYFLTLQPGGIKQNHIHVDNIDVSGFGGRGMLLGGFNGDAGYNDVRVTNSRFFGNVNSGLETFAQNRDANTNVYVAHNEAFDNTGDNVNITNQPTGSGIVLGQVSNAVAEFNSTYRNGSSGDGGVGLWTYESDGVVIQFNESYDNRTASAVDGGGFDLDGGTRNSVIQYNYSHNNDGAGLLYSEFDGASGSENNVFRYNISENDGRKNSFAGILVFGNDADDVATDAVFHNNVIAVSDSDTGGSPSAVRFWNVHHDDIRLYNNAFLIEDRSRVVNGNGSDETKSTFLGNSYFSQTGFDILFRYGGVDYRSVEEWAVATGQEILDGDLLAILDDPLFTDPFAGVTVGDPTALDILLSYLPQEGSPLIDAGLDLQALFGIDPGLRDYLGGPIPQGAAFDVGAIEVVPELGAAAILVAFAALAALRLRSIHR